MPLEPGVSQLSVVLLATLLGGVLGWWPLAAWARRSVIGAAAPKAASGAVSTTGEATTERAVAGRQQGVSAGSAPDPAGPATTGSAPGTDATVPTARGAADSAPEATGDVAAAVSAGPRSSSVAPTPAGSAAEVASAAGRPASRAVRPAAAAVTAAVWGLAVWRVDAEPVLPAVLAFSAAATVLALVDLWEHRLPNRVTGPAFVAVAALLAAAAMGSGEWAALLCAGVGGAAMFVAYLLVALVSPSAMGMGDVKLAGLIGLLLGWFGLEAWVLGLVAAFVIGGLVAVVALALRRVTLRGSIPFGPSMLAGAVLSVLLVA